MVPLRLVCSFVLTLLIPIYILAQVTNITRAPTSVFPEVGNTSCLLEQFEDDSCLMGVFQNVFDSIERHLAEMQNVTGFSTEACAASNNSGPCVYTHVAYVFNEVNATCSIYTVGNCDFKIAGYPGIGCTHQCRLVTGRNSSTANTTVAVP